MKPKNAIEVKNVTKKFRVYRDKGQTLKEKLLFHKRSSYKERIVLDDISFEIAKGEAVGLIGHNGCGKSTMLKLLAKIMYPDSGTVEMCGRVSSLIELGAGFHPDLSGRENIYINASIFGLSKKEIDSRMEDIITFSGLRDYLDNPVRTYSSGMYMRLAFSVAINVDADILLIDEILAVGDANFQAKCFDKLREIQFHGTTIVIVAHDTSAIEGFCSKAVWINQGKIAAQGKAGEVVDAYLAFMNGKKIEELHKMEELHEHKIKDLHKEEKRKKDRKEIKQKEAKTNETEDTNHFGRMDIQIDRAEMINENGEAATIFQTGEYLKINIYYKVIKPLTEYVFGVGIYNLNGETLYGNNTQLDHIRIPHTNNEGCVIFHLKNLPLLSGKYILNVGIVDTDGTPLDFYRNYCTFDVVSKDRSTGYFSIEHSWEIRSC